jgi:hypothetical protein
MMDKKKYSQPQIKNDLKKVILSAWMIITYKYFKRI